MILLELIIKCGCNLRHYYSNMVVREVLYKYGYNVTEDVWKAPIIQMNKTLGERNDLRCINM